MTIEEVLKLIRTHGHRDLTAVQEQVLRQAWEGLSYSRMATTSHYDATYLRNIASQLWQEISPLFNFPLNKKNFRDTLEPRPLSFYQVQPPRNFCHPPSPGFTLEFPSGPVPLSSNFYIERPPLEELAYAEIKQPGTVIRIKAPKKTGKSSLMLRILADAAQEGYHTVCLDFQQAEAVIFDNIEKLLRWFCMNMSRQLNIKPALHDFWDKEMGSKVSCTIYFEGYLLEQLVNPLVLVLNEVNRIFEYPSVAEEFLSLLRSWHEEAKQVEIWQKLRLVVVHSTEVYIPLNLNQSPFNVGITIKLPEFNLAQVQELARRHQLDWSQGQAAQELMAMVGGHPYLIRIALYYLSRGDITLRQLLQEAPTLSGVYSDHLRCLLVTLQGYSELAAAFQKVVKAKDRVRIEPLLAYKLDSMGLVHLQGDDVILSCQLYRLYFSSQLSEFEQSWMGKLKQLEQENQHLQELVNLDSLTGLANRRCFDLYLQKQWQQLAMQKAWLSLILCDLDFFKRYNDTYGHQAGDDCLRQVAHAILEVVSNSPGLAARYGGEEFAIILPQTSAEQAILMAESIREKVKLSLRLPGITASFGVASMVPREQSFPEPLVAAADKALYQSKSKGRDCVTLTPV